MRAIEVEMIVVERKKETVKIELPIYREHIVGDYSTIYTRINEDLSAIHITKNDKRWDNSKWGFEIEYKEKYDFRAGTENYHLGRGVYSLSEQEFNEILGELRQFVSKI